MEASGILLRPVRRLPGRERLREEAGRLPGVAEGGRALARDEDREGVVDGGRETVLARRLAGVVEGGRSKTSDERPDRLDMAEAGRATASFGGSSLMATTLDAGQKTPFPGAQAKY